MRMSFLSLPFPGFRSRPMSPINQRRWRNFKANKRGYWSLWVFGVLFFLSLFAEFIANDKPLMLTYEGGLYFPVLVSYPETAFGGDFETEADYRDPFVKDLIHDAGGFMVWPLIEYSYRTINLDLPVPAPAPPSAENWLGTDDQGRDVTARLIYGFRISALFGLTFTFLSSVIGVTAGAVQGYFGGWTDLLFQRFIAIWTHAREPPPLMHHAPYNMHHAPCTMHHAPRTITNAPCNMHQAQASISITTSPTHNTPQTTHQAPRTMRRTSRCTCPHS